MMYESPLDIDATIFKCDLCRSCEISTTRSRYREFPLASSRCEARANGWMLQRLTDFCVCPGCVEKIKSGEVGLL